MNVGRRVFTNTVCCFGNLLYRNFNKRTQKFDYKKLVKVNKKANKKPRLSLILKEDVPKLGAAGQMVQVKRGYGRNDLILNRLAVYATDESKKNYLATEKEESVKSQVEDPKILPFFESALLNITVKESEIPWQITAKDISLQCRKKLNIVVPIDCVELLQPITSTGDYVVGIVINENVRTKLKCSVVST